MEKTFGSYVQRNRCPVYTALQVIEGRWKPMMIRRLGEGPISFGELRRSMPAVTVKVLRQQLRELQAHGIVERLIDSNPSARVRYVVTQHGQALGPVFESLWAWGVAHLAREIARPPAE